MHGTGTGVLAPEHGTHLAGAVLAAMITHTAIEQVDIGPCVLDPRQIGDLCTVRED